MVTGCPIIFYGARGFVSYSYKQFTFGNYLTNYLYCSYTILKEDRQMGKLFLGIFCYNITYLYSACYVYLMAYLERNFVFSVLFTLIGKD